MKAILLVLTSAIALALVTPASPAVQPPAGVSIKVDKDQVDFLVGKELVTSYHIKSDQPRPFLWPLKAPCGISATRDWPMGKALPGEEKDHTHHRSAWFGYGDVIPEGMVLKTKLKGIEGIDFWADTKGHGNIVCTRVDQPKIGPEGSSILTHNEWRTSTGEKVMDENRKITFVTLGKAYLIVLDLDFDASVCPIIFGDTKEGAMAIRIHSQVAAKQGQGKIQNAEGKINEKQLWGLKSAWCDYSGKIDGTMVGVAILDDPANPYAACWHSRDYGLMAANPFGRDKGSKFPGVKGNNERVRLAKGEHLHLRYGVLVHNGNAAEGQVDAAYQRFVKMREAPPLR